MLYNIYHAYGYSLHRYDAGVTKAFVNKMVEAYLKGEVDVIISGKSYKIGSQSFQIYAVPKEISDSNTIKLFISNVITTKYGGKFSEKVLSDNFKNVTKLFLKERGFGDLKESLYNLYVNGDDKNKYHIICLDRTELQNFLNDWALGKSIIWVGGSSMELNKPKSIRIFDIKNEYLSKDRGDVKSLINKWVAIGRNKLSISDFTHFGKDVTSEWNVPAYASKLNNQQTVTPAQKFDWSMIHPLILEQSQSRFNSNHFADAVEAAFKEINDIIKTEYSIVEKFEKDGDKLMKQVFSVENPKFKLADLNTESGKSIQQGYMEIFAGAMKGIRNPKAHKNLIIDETDAWEKIVLASHLMKIWDRRIK